MTFMLSEVLAQALAQINSPAQRLRQSHARVPRHLNSIILTVPPAMPQPERKIFEQRMRQAIGLIWKSMGWHPEDAGMDTGDLYEKLKADTAVDAVFDSMNKAFAQLEVAAALDNTPAIAYNKAETLDITVDFKQKVTV